MRAPFSGVLGLTTATLGTYVSPGTEITTLSRVRPVKIDFAVPGRFAANVRVGDVVSVVDETTNKKFDAKVYAIDPQIDPVSRTQPVRARYANTNNEPAPRRLRARQPEARRKHDGPAGAHRSRDSGSQRLQRVHGEGRQNGAQESENRHSIR
ncbi:efflux RND transporter periplasmic adaptor subunit [Hymenobacter humi]|uniref:Efflux RND transporter periplasmic adaptor subunit n=1 Tax=Hymenobacter humi TaxID=1411620 RepID=A0ABW2U8T8_9BACT